MKNSLEIITIQFSPIFFENFLMSSCNKYILSNFGTNHHRHTRALLISEEFLKKFEHLVRCSSKKRKKKKKRARRFYPTIETVVYIPRKLVDSFKTRNSDAGGAHLKHWTRTTLPYPTLVGPIRKL